MMSARSKWQLEMVMVIATVMALVMVAVFVEVFLGYAFAQISRVAQGRGC